MRGAGTRLERQLRPDRVDGAGGAMPRMFTDGIFDRRVLNILIDERANLLVTGRDSDLVSRWARSIATTLRARADIAFDIYLPASAEVLIARFNSVMAMLTLQSARADSSSVAPSRILLVPDVRSLMTPEGQLLARLVNDFPAVGLRLLMLADAEAEAASRSLRELFSRRLRQLSLDSAITGSTLHTGSAPLDSDQNPPRRERGSGSPSRLPSRGSADTLVAEFPGPVPVERWSTGRRRVAWSAAAMSLLLVSVLIAVLLSRDRSPGGYQRESRAALNVSPAQVKRQVGTGSAGAVTASPAGRVDAQSLGARP